MSAETTATTASVSTHVLDTSIGRPAEGVPVTLSARGGPEAEWVVLGASSTGPDGRCADLPEPPEGTAQVRLVFRTEAYVARDPRPDAPRGSGGGGAFFPEVAVAFAVAAGEHYHVPLLLNPFGYSVYRGS
ncbi:hydroxyisourate hydrolase [Streptomyces katsurahamanus]|uniref:5-hydroxyisourate hydrolase n=1 Tax=Streptomyces katsurahamanus TaxID=2577098 RepID=A0ABW9NS96_9ACTN|nr:hydroxyisourate hydrolase [Streptomyces katsurahamanus]MQS36026.1 hydroxyisourate hydrolase [Streptomyces katsurahamanus]